MLTGWTVTVTAWLVRLTSNRLNDMKIIKDAKPVQITQTEQVVRIKVPRRYVAALWLLTLIALTGLGLGVYSYVSMPSRIQNYVSQHKSELKGDKGATGDTGSAGLDGVDGSSGSSGSFNCTTYGIDRQFTSCN